MAEDSTGEPRVWIAAPCWVCDALQYQNVHWLDRRHQHFSWSCPACGVGWAGPGTIVPPDRAAS